MSVIGCADSGALLSVQKLTKLFGSFAACNQIDLEIAPGRNPRSSRRKRRRQIDAGRRCCSAFSSRRMAEMVWEGRPVRSRTRRRPQARHRHGLSAFLAVRGADGCREYRAVAGRQHSDRPDRRAGEVAVATPMACRSIRMPMSPIFRSASASASRSSARCCRTRKLIILDEPTSVLTPQEADKLFETLFKLKAEGRSVLYISHRLEEVQRICDRATVLRHGKVTGACDPRQETPASLARMMVGSDVAGVTQTGSGTEGRSAAGCTRPVRRATHALCHVAEGRVADGALRRSAGDRRCCRQRPGRAVRCAVGRISRCDNATAVLIRGKAVGTHGHQRAPPAGRRLRAGGAPRPRRRFRHEAFGQPRAGAQPVRPQERSSAAVSSRSSVIGACSSGDQAHLRGHGRAQERRRSRRPARCRAATCRNSSSAANSTASRAVLVVNQPTWGVDAGRGEPHPAGARRSRQRRLRRAGHQPGSRRDLRGRHRNRRDLRRPAVEAYPARRADAREDRPADGRPARQHDHGGGAMRIELEKRPHASTLFTVSVATASRWR